MLRGACFASSPGDHDSPSDVAGAILRYCGKRTGFPAYRSRGCPSRKASVLVGRKLVVPHLEHKQTQERYETTRWQMCGFAALETHGGFTAGLCAPARLSDTCGRALALQRAGPRLRALHALRFSVHPCRLHRRAVWSASWFPCIVWPRTDIPRFQPDREELGWTRTCPDTASRN